MKEMRSGFTFPIMDTGHDVVNYWKGRPMIYCFSAASLWKEGKVLCQPFFIDMMEQQLHCTSDNLKDQLSAIRLKIHLMSDAQELIPLSSLLKLT